MDGVLRWRLELELGKFVALMMGTLGFWARADKIRRIARKTHEPLAGLIPAGALELSELSAPLDGVFHSELSVKLIACQVLKTGWRRSFSDHHLGTEYQVNLDRTPALQSRRTVEPGIKSSYS